MDYTNILRELQSASLFDLYRLRAAIDIEVDRPERIEQVRRQLKPGQAIDYFDTGVNGLARATIVELKRTRVVVRNQQDGKLWSIPFAAINIDNVTVDIGSGSAQQPLDRNRLRVGDVVGFRDRQNEEQYGRVLALNQKTASILTNQGQRWRVAYEFLFRVLDTEAGQSGEARQPANAGQSADAGGYKVLELSFQDEDEDDESPLPATTPARTTSPSQSVSPNTAMTPNPFVSPTAAGAPTTPPPAEHPAWHKVGVNDPCPCGSGKKYK